MKSLVLALTAATALLSTSALAAPVGRDVRLSPDAITGTVVVNQPMCIVAPCPAFVSIQTDKGSVAIPHGSRIADDVSAFAGKTVTVQGTLSDHAIDAQAFMPGKSADFVTGTIHTRCMNGAASCRAFIEVDGSQYMINGDFKNYAGLDGATVTLPGMLHSNCPMGAMCITNIVSFYPRGTRVMVKGNLGMLMRNVHGPIVPQAGNYLLTLDGGKTVVVDAGAHNWMDHDGQTVWLSGHMNAGGGDLAPYFTATNISRPVYDNHSQVSVDDGMGNNSARSASTNPASTSASASTGSGAGIKR